MNKAFFSHVCTLLDVAAHMHEFYVTSHTVAPTICNLVIEGLVEGGRASADHQVFSLYFSWSQGAVVVLEHYTALVT